MLRLLLVGMTLAMMPLASAQDDEAADQPEPFGVTLTCSAAIPSVTLGCFAERPILTLGPLEVAIGVDAEVALNAPPEGQALVQLQGTPPNVDGHLAPYIVGAWYAEGWSAWAELRLPSLSGVPAIGDADYLRVGFTTRF